MSYPEDCIQSLVDNWWLPQSPQVIERGTLVLIAVPYVDVRPDRLVLRGRSEDKDHQRADYTFSQFNINERPPRISGLPVAAIPERPGEVRLVYRAKVRPGIVVGAPGRYPDSMPGAAKWMTSSVMQVAPSHGVDKDGTRGGWPPVLVESVRRCQHPQYVWDRLPHGSRVEESILCLDRILPVCTTPGTFKFLGFKLSEEALEIVEDWMCWCRTQTLSTGGMLELAHREFGKLAQK